MNQHSDTKSLYSFFAYFFAPDYDRPAPAIYRIDRNKPGFAKLYLVNYGKKRLDTEEVIQIGRCDLAAAIRATEPLCGRISKPSHLQAVLYEEGYDRPGYEPAEIEIPEDAFEN